MRFRASLRWQMKIFNIHCNLNWLITSHILYFLNALSLVDLSSLTTITSCTACVRKQSKANIQFHIVEWFSSFHINIKCVWYLTVFCGWFTCKHTVKTGQSQRMASKKNSDNVHIPQRIHTQRIHMYCDICQLSFLVKER